MKAPIAATALLFGFVTSLHAQDVAVVNPRTIRVKLDNEHVRVMEATIAPGVKENQHSHPTSIVYVIAGGKVRTHLPNGTTSEATYTAGQTVYRDPVTHWAENIGTTTIRLLVVELKASGSSSSQSPLSSPSASVSPLASPAENAEAAAAVDATLRQYASMVAAMDHAGIAALFTPDGEIVNPGQASIRGRDAIDRMLSAFAGFQMMENQTTPTGTVATGDSATQTGTYHQRVRTPAGQTVEVSGTFRAEWCRASTGQWLIRKMETTPSVSRSHL